MKLCDLLQEQADSLRAGKEYAVVTIVEADQLARTNGKMIVYADGSISGTVGGGMWEQAARADALEALKNGKNLVKTYTFAEEFQKAGFRHDGRMTAFIEVFRDESLQLVVVGGGHVGNAVIRAAKMVGFTTTLVDTRDREIIGDSIDLADRFVKVPSFEDVAKADLPREPYYVISTYGHMVDGAALGAVLSRKDARYVGMLGGRKKITAIYEKLEAAGFDRAQLEAVHSPIGLDLGGETPEELSIGIVAEIMAVKNGRSGLFSKG